MRGLRVIVIALLGMPLIASVCGCTEKPGSQASPRSAAKNQEALSEQGESQVDTESILLADVLALWESGKKDDAVEQLVLIRWSAPDVFADLPVLNLSEKRLTSLPRSERTSIQEESIEHVTTFRALARHTLSVGDNAQASGDKETAKVHYEAVQHFGEALSSPERLLVIQLVGKAIAKSAQDKTSAVK